MKKLALVLMLVISLVVTWSAWGMNEYLTEKEIKGEAERGLGEILDLWRDGKYDDLYDRTLAGGKQTKEDFVGRLSAAPFRPACCWEKLQEVRSVVKNDSTVVIRAKVGLEGGTGSSAKTRSFKLVKEEGVWLISQADILSLSGDSHKKRSHPKEKRKRSHHY